MIFRSGLALLSLCLLASCAASLKAHGTIVDQPAPELGLRSSQRAPFLLSDQRGNEVILFFGYTHCGDICPETLAHVARALELIGVSKEPIQTVFISVDPSRDTPVVADRYAQRFSARFIGLSGSPRQLAGVERAYHVWSKTMPPDRMGNYEVAHSSQIFLIAPNGHLRIIEDWDIPVPQLAEDIRALQ